MMKEDKEALAEQYYAVKRAVILVFVPMFLILGVMIYFRNNSSGYIKKEYLKVHNSHYSGKITSLLPEVRKSRIRPVLIEGKYNHDVPSDVYDKLSVGDSLYKEANSDDEYFVRITGDTLKVDVNFDYRRKYFESLQKE